MPQRRKKKRPAAKPTVRSSSDKAERSSASRGLTFNHAMLYSADVARALKFYAGALGFQLIDEFAYEGRVVYARLRSPGSDSTIALHQLERGKTLTQGEGVRLYLEIEDLEAYCKKLEEAGIALEGPPKLAPWGWKHTYLSDPDGHELSLYWAGPKRLQKTQM